MRDDCLYTLIYFNTIFAPGVHFQAEGDFDAVWMSGSGSTIVGFGSDAAPSFLGEPEYETVLTAKARLLTRPDGKWYQPVES